MSYTAHDMSDRLIELLKAKGYTVHSDGTLPKFLQDPHHPTEGGWWFSWTAPSEATQVGETYDNELSAWADAMEHYVGGRTLLEALQAATAFVELSTGDGCRRKPPAWAIKPNGDFDAEEIAKRARGAIAQARAGGASL